MTYRAQPPGPTQQEAAPALSEGVIWFVGQVRGSGKRRQESARGSGRVDVRGGASLSSSASPRSSGTHTGKLLELCTSETPERERAQASRINIISLLRSSVDMQKKILTDKSMQKMPAVGHEALTRFRRDNTLSLC